MQCLFFFKHAFIDLNSVIETAFHMIMSPFMWQDAVGPGGLRTQVKAKALGQVARVHDQLQA